MWPCSARPPISSRACSTKSLVLSWRNLTWKGFLPTVQRDDKIFIDCTPSTINIGNNCFIFNSMLMIRSTKLCTEINSFSKFFKYYCWPVNIWTYWNYCNQWRDVGAKSRRILARNRERREKESEKEIETFFITYSLIFLLEKTLLLQEMIRGGGNEFQKIYERKRKMRKSANKN